jgi:uncharacterized protein involved in exopolysaccharide biosynthesis
LLAPFLLPPCVSGTGPQESSDATGKWLDNMLPPDEVGPESSADPIARNPKDVGKLGEAVQATEVRRRSEVSVPPAGAALLSGPAGGFQQHPPTAPPATDLVVSILRFKWTILIVWVLVSAPTIAAVWTQIIPKYAVRAEVRVRPIIPRLVFRTEDNGAIPFYESFVNTQVSIIRGPTVLQRVLDQPEIQKTTWYKNPPKSLTERARGTVTPPIERLRDGLSARPRPRTEIIDVAFVDISGKDAKVIVDAVLEQYVKYIGETADATQDKLDHQLTDQYNSLKNEIQGRESIIAALHKTLGTETPQELVSNRRVRLDEAQARLSDLQDRITVLQWEMRQAGLKDSNNASATAPGSPEIPPRYATDAEWRQLDLGVRTAQHQIDITIMTPNHPDRARLTKNLAFAQELCRSREAQLDEQWNDRLTNGTGLVTTLGGASTLGPEGGVIPVDRQLARAKVEEQLLRAELGKQEADFNDLFDRAQSLAREDAALQQKRELFDAVRQRLDQKNMERGVPGSIEVLMSASVPSKPAQDRRVVFTIMALFAGLGMGGGLAFLRASRNQTIYAPKDMPQPAQIPFLGYVPLVHLKKLRRSVCNEIEQNQFLLIDSVRVLRTALLSRLHGQGNTTVVVTSANEGTGKSSFTMVLVKSDLPYGWWARGELATVGCHRHERIWLWQTRVQDRNVTRRSSGCKPPSSSSRAAPPTTKPPSNWVSVTGPYAAGSKRSESPGTCRPKDKRCRWLKSSRRPGGSWPNCVWRTKS